MINISLFRVINTKLKWVMRSHETFDGIDIYGWWFCEKRNITDDKANAVLW